MGLTCGENCLEVFLVKQDGLDGVLNTRENRRDLAWHASEEWFRRWRTARNESIHSMEKVPQLIELEGKDGSCDQVIVSH